MVSVSFFAPYQSLVNPQTSFQSKDPDQDQDKQNFIHISVSSMCYTKLSTYYCSTPFCSSPSEPYKEELTYSLCTPSYLGHEGYHVDTLRSDPISDPTAQRFSHRTGTCDTCVHAQRPQPTLLTDDSNTPALQAGPEGEAKTKTKILTPTPQESTTWLCHAIESSPSVRCFAVNLVSAIYALELDGTHQDGAILAAAVYIAGSIFSQPIKIRALRQQLQVEPRQIEAAYSMLHENRGRLLDRVGGGVERTWMSDATLNNLPKPTRSSRPEREHWMM